MEKMLILYTFNIFTNLLSFTCQIIHLKNVDLYTFYEEWVESEKVFVLYSFKCWQLWTAPNSHLFLNYMAYVIYIEI